MQRSEWLATIRNRVLQGGRSAEIPMDGRAGAFDGLDAEKQLRSPRAAGRAGQELSGRWERRTSAECGA